MTPDTLHPATLQAQPISGEVLLEKYAKEGEQTVDDVRRRVVRAVAVVVPVTSSVSVERPKAIVAR